MRKLLIKRVLDIQSTEVPQEMRTCFFDHMRGNGNGNDCWIQYVLGYIDKFDGWLISNYEDLEEGDEILIKHWW
jgi:hypothetical protein